VSLHPLGCSVEQVHLLLLLVVLLLHHSEDLFPLLPLFQSLLMLFSDSLQFMVSLIMIHQGLLFLFGVLSHLCVVLGEDVVEVSIGFVVVLPHLFFFLLVLVFHLEQRCL
jgi:hypothetical protein